MNQSEKAPAKSGHDSTLRILVALVALLVMGAIVTGFVVVIDRLDSLHRKHDELKTASADRDAKSARAAQTAADHDNNQVAIQADMLGQLTQFDERQVKLGEERRQAEAKHAAAVDRFEKSYEKTAKERQDELMRQMQGLGERLRAAEARNDILAKEVAELRYPPLPEGEEPILQITHRSTGGLTAKAKEKRELLAFYLNFSEQVARPDKLFLKKVAALYRAGGTPVTDEVYEIVVCKDGKYLEYKEGDKSKSWSVTLKYGGTAVVPFTDVQVFGSRIRMLPYRSARPAEDIAKIKKALRVPLREFAKDMGAHGGDTSDWGPNSGGYEQLFLRP